MDMYILCIYKQAISGDENLTKVYLNVWHVTWSGLDLVQTYAESKTHTHIHTHSEAK